MDTNQVLGRNELFSAMQAGKPFKSYIKAILGQVEVTVWDNFLDKPTSVILKGNPRNKEETCIVDVWSERENMFFLRTNRKHFSTGTIIAFTRVVEEEAKEKPIEQFSDEELRSIINKKYLALTSIIRGITSTAVLFRMRGLAEDMEKSEKITKVIENRISELQMGEVTRKDSNEVEEE